jgi:hypothetical protein
LPPDRKVFGRYHQESEEAYEKQKQEEWHHKEVYLRLFDAWFSFRVVVSQVFVHVFSVVFPLQCGDLCVELACWDSLLVCLGGQEFFFLWEVVCMWFIVTVFAHFFLS